MNLFGEKDDLDIELDKLAQEKLKLVEEERKRAQSSIIKQKAAGISDSAFWISYCGMQKAIRQGNVEVSKRLASVAWLKNSWLVYRRLHVILFEDIGAGSPACIKMMKNFYADGRSFKNLADIHYVIENLCNAVKSRDADTMLCMNFRKNLVHANLSEAGRMALEFHKRPYEYYILHDEDYDMDIVRYIQGLEEKILTEFQGRQIPYLLKISDGIEIEPSNNLTSPSHNEFFEGIMPYTVLDLHGMHGKQTMAIFHKKMKADHMAYLKSIGNIKEESIGEVLNFLVFAFEGGRCANEIRITDTYNEMWSYFFKGHGVKLSLQELEESFKPYLVRLKTLREWMFQKRFSKIIEEVKNVEYGELL
jgi:hypothetical protein